MTTTTAATTDALTEWIEELEPFQLAGIAYCGTPADDSEGAKALSAVRDQVIEFSREVDAEDWDRELVRNSNGKLTECANAGMGSGNTRIKWQMFADLAAYQEDLAEYHKEWKSSMDADADMALGQIFERLALSLAQMIERATYQ